MWILPNNHPLASQFVRDYSESNEDLKEYFQGSEPPLMWKSKPSSWKTFSQQWKRVWWMQHLCGRILKPSTRSRFEASLTSYLVDTRVNPFLLPETGGGADDPRHLWPYLYTITETIKPVCCFFENVSGHLSMGYDQVYRDLRSLGYRVETGIYTASEVGASHQRERLFILAILADTSNIGFNGRNSGNGNAGIWQMDTNKENRPNLQCKIEGCCNEMANTIRGLFPAGQGSFQYEWEEPRTIESSMEYTINGYNFTEDLHRAIGNSVVEQTAELAFRDLWSKHFPGDRI